MASVAPVEHLASIASPAQPSNFPWVKVLAESPDLKSIPSRYAYFNTTDDSSASDPEVSIPVIDYSLLTSGTPEQRTKVVHKLDKACQDWGFFMVVNHGIPDTLMKAMIDVCDEFFNLPEEEKLRFETKNVLNPIRCGTSFNVAKDQVFFWRDFLKLFVHPEFHCPNKPEALSDLLLEYSQRVRELSKTLVQGISQSLGLEEGYMEKSLELDSSLQTFIGNLYPPCPQPELAMGLPPHSDHGLFTILIQNEVGGLQIQHNGEWCNVNALPNSLLVNTGDHLEIFSNGKYKSVLHRAIVNNKRKRISIALVNGPSADAIVSPASAILEREGRVPAYKPTKYRDYLEQQQGNKINGKACVDRVKIL